jgi:hypothetical protein
MKTLASLLLVFSSVAALAADSDPGYGPKADAERPATRSSRRAAFDNYYRPLQYFYGDGYTVAYRLVPVDERIQRRLRNQGVTEQMRIPSESVDRDSAVSPRVVVSRKKKKTSTINYAPAKRAKGTVTSVGSPTKELPPVAEGPQR